MPRSSHAGAGRMAGPDVSAAHASSLVGRVGEMTAFAAGLDALLQGRGRLVFLTGEPGIGKTRLATECARLAHARGLPILWGRCWEGGGAEEYWPWKRALRHHVRCLADGELAAQLGSGAVYVARLVPEIGRRLGLAPVPSRSILPDVDGVRFALFEAVTAFLQAAAARTPMVVVLDDLHAADLPSLMLLRFVARELHDAPLLLLGTFRDGEARVTPEIGDALADLAREALWLRLRGFSPEEVAEFLRAAIRRDASPAAVREIHAVTDGNPFFVDEIVRLMTSQESLADLAATAVPALSIPDGVRAAIRQRLLRLPPVTLDVLRLAAVLGREFEPRLLLAAWNPSDAAAGRGTALEEHLRTALLADVVLPASNRGERLAFRHGLIRDTLYDDLPPRSRVRLHRRAASALERRHAAAGDVAPGELAHHLALGAEDNEDRRSAVRFLLQAAEQAVGRAAFEAARDRLAEAEVLLAQLPTEQELLCEVLLAQADVSMRLGRREESRARCVRVAEIARARDLTGVLARAAIGFGWHFDASATDHEGIRLLEEALERLPADQERLRPRLMARLAKQLYHVTGAEVRRETLSVEAVALARASGDAATLAFTLNARLFTLWRPASAGTRLEQARELLALALGCGERELELQSRQWLVGSLLELGDLNAATNEMLAYRQRATELRQPLYFWLAACWDVLRATLEGRLDEVEALAEKAFATGDRVEPENAAATHAAQIFSLRWLQGRLGEMAPAMRGLAQDSPFADSWRRALVLMHEQADDIEAARREMEVACPLAADALRTERLTMHTDLVLLVDACRRLGDMPRAALLYEALLPHADRLMVLGLGVATFGSVSSYLGVLAATLERWEEAREHFAVALAMLRRLGARPYLAATLCALGEIQAARGEAAAARASLREARSLADAVGMPRIAARAAAALEA